MYVFNKFKKVFDVYKLLLGQFSTEQYQMPEEFH